VGVLVEVHGAGALVMFGVVGILGLGLHLGTLQVAVSQVTRTWITLLEALGVSFIGSVLAGAAVLIASLFHADLAVAFATLAGFVAYATALTVVGGIEPVRSAFSILLWMVLQTIATAAIGGAGMALINGLPALL
jgi:hypothetical protein